MKRLDVMVHHGWKIPATIGILAAALGSSGCHPPAEAKPGSSVQANPSATKAIPRQEPIYFLKGDGTLSPGAIAKLKTWVEAWGRQGTWKLSCPTGPGLTFELLEKRISAIRAELHRLGVAKVETTLLPSAPVGQYDAIYVEKAPS